MDAANLGRQELRDRRLIEGVIANVDLLRGIAPMQAAAVARHCYAFAVRSSTVVASRGARLPGIFAVAYGTVKLSLRSSGGDERVVRLAQAAQTFGEPSALLGRPAPFEARALTECKLVVVPVAPVFALMESDPRAARQIVLTLAERTIALMGEMEASSLLSAGQRLARYLLSLAGAESAVRLPTSKTTVAARLGMKKETLSRLLASLAERGVIEVRRREVALLDRVRLDALAAGARLSSDRGNGASAPTAGHT